MILKALIVLSVCVSCFADKYIAVLQKSILFYEAQRSGDLPSNNRVPWRGDSAMDDKDGSVNLSGGWYDAGDYVKFNFPMAWAVTTIAWGMLEFKSAYSDAGEYNNAKNQIKWALDYFIKCHPSANVYYVQVGNGDTDHAYFGRPEQMRMSRPAYKITTRKPGSDIAAETAAAMAAGYLIFKDSNPSYARTLKNHAVQLFDFAKNYQRKYSDHGSEFRFYTSSGYKDELVWAAAWLYRATRQNTYLSYAERNIGQLGSGPSWAFSWDDKKVGAQMLLYQLTRKSSYKGSVQSYLRSWRTGGSLTYTPQGLAWRNQWGANRYTVALPGLFPEGTQCQMTPQGSFCWFLATVQLEADRYVIVNKFGVNTENRISILKANTAAIALLAAKQGIYVDMGSNRNNKAWALRQINLLLGGSGRSYVVGYGSNYPKKPHHRASACPRSRSQTCNQNTFNNEGVNNPNILQGALVGGPAANGSYKDQRGDYIQSEVAVDYNAGWQTAVAGAKYFS